MKVLKYKIDADYFEKFKKICDDEEITVKKKLNVLLAEDRNTSNIMAYFPEEHDDKLRKMTLKVSEELYKGVMKKCGQHDLRVKDYLAYLVYKFLSDEYNKSN